MNTLEIAKTGPGQLTDCLKIFVYLCETPEVFELHLRLSRACHGKQAFFIGNFN